MGRELGGLIGPVSEIDTNASGDCLGKFIRARINVDISKPLPKLLKVGLINGVPKSLIPLKFERLPDLCFCCGIIGHPLRECNLLPSNVPRGHRWKYGDFIRASPVIRAPLPHKRSRGDKMADG